MENNTNMPTCWAEVQFDGNLTFEQLLALLNTFNQRLSLLEDTVVIKKQDGTEASITEYINEESRKQMEQQQQENK